MNFYSLRKKTRSEVEDFNKKESNQRDKTEGYNFLAWLIWKERQKGAILVFFIFLSIKLFVENYFWFGCGFISASCIILSLLLSHYNSSKNLF